MPHDCGMGGLRWWVRASSAEEITAAFAQVEVVGDPEATAQARTRDLDGPDIEDAKRGKLAGFHETRQRQRQDPAFGGLVGRQARLASILACLRTRARTPVRDQSG